LTGVNDDDYKPPFPLTAKLNKLTIKVDRTQLSPEDIKTLQAAMREGQSRLIPRRQACRPCPQGTACNSRLPVTKESNVAFWPKCEVPPGSELVCFPGNTGSDGSYAKAREVFQN
jgi:hypothetical protein